MIEAGCEGKPVAQCAAPAQSPFVAKSSYIGGPLPESAVTAIVSALSSLPASLPGAGGGVVFDGYGGAINQVAPSETAFVHRNAVSCAQYSITYAERSSDRRARKSAASAWLRGSAPGFRASDAGLVPELHRSHLGRLAAGLLRIEPAPPATGEAETTTPTTSSISRSRSRRDALDGSRGCAREQD